MLKIKIFITILMFLLSIPGLSVAKSLEFKDIQMMSSFNPDESIGNVIGNYTFIDNEGNKFSLDKLKGKPYILSMIYTSCGIICPNITISLTKALRNNGPDLGTKFNVLTVGFDSLNDSPEELKEFDRAFALSNPSWKFASSDNKTIESLSRDLGFYYKKVDEEFEHVNMVTVVDAGGRVYRHILGTEYTPEQLLTPINESLAGKPPELGGDVSFFEGAILWCLEYDPVTGEYSPDWGHISFLMAGVAIHFILLGFLRYILKSIRKYDASTEAQSAV